MSSATEPRAVERRRAVRQKSFLRGMIYFNNRRNAVDCLIRDISPYGARLIFSDAVTTPDVLELYIPQKEQTLRVHAIWRHGQEVGVAFAQAAHMDPVAEPGDLAEGVDGKVLFAAFTGKAALVMRSKGCERASTIHSLIYKTRESGEEVPSFDLWDEAPASKAALIVIDECSMVDAELGRDLMSFGVPLLVLGDPAQLPPIQGGGFFTQDEPHAMLTAA